MPEQKYLCIQRSQPGNGEPPSPEAMKEMYACFQAWMDKFKANIVDLGGRLGGGKVVSKVRVTDGPYAEAKEVIGGFTIVRAKSLEEAVAVERECPGLMMPGSSVEVRLIETS